VLYACDARWWRHHKGVPEFTGLKLTQCQAAAQEFGLRWIKGEHKPGLSFDPGIIHYGSNSGYQALNIAVLMGAKRIILLGFDMRRIAGKSHFFGEHPKGMSNGDGYGMFIEKFKTVVDPLREHAIEVVNCTPESALPWFEMKRLEDAL